MRPIDADAIPYKRDIVVTERFPKFGGFNGKIVYSVTKEEIDAMPTVDAVPVRHGRWTDDNACPFCGFQPWYERDIHTLSYCPNCGAKMDGKDGKEVDEDDTYDKKG